MFPPLSPSRLSLLCVFVCMHEAEEAAAYEQRDHAKEREAGLVELRGDLRVLQNRLADKETEIHNVRPDLMPMLSLAASSNLVLALRPCLAPGLPGLSVRPTYAGPCNAPASA